MARMDQCERAHAISMWYVRTGKKENWTTEKPMGRATFRRVAGQESSAAKNQSKWSRYKILNTQSQSSQLQAGSGYTYVHSDASTNLRDQVTRCKRQ